MRLEQKSEGVTASDKTKNPTRDDAVLQKNFTQPSRSAPALSTKKGTFK